MKVRVPIYTVRSVVPQRVTGGLNEMTGTGCKELAAQQVPNRCLLSHGSVNRPIHADALVCDCVLGGPEKKQEVTASNLKV